MHDWAKWPYYVAIGKCLGLKQINPEHCALAVIDIQPDAVNADGFMGLVGAYNRELLDRFQTRMNEIVWPNLEKLIDFFRSREMFVVYTVIGGGDVHPRLKPREGEPVIIKHRCSAFGNSPFDLALRSQKIDTVFFTGVSTSHCVTRTALAALDHDYGVIAIEDACADPRTGDHDDAAMKILGLHAYVQTTERVIADYPWHDWIDAESPPATSTA